MNPKDWIEIQVITDDCPYAPELKNWIREETWPMGRRQSILDPPLYEVAMRRFSQVFDVFVLGSLLRNLVVFVVLVHEPDLIDVLIAQNVGSVRFTDRGDAQQASRRALDCESWNDSWIGGYDAG
jgi:hypothetical protein